MHEDGNLWRKIKNALRSLPFPCRQCTAAPPRQTRAHLPTRNPERRKRRQRVQCTGGSYKEVRFGCFSDTEILRHRHRLTNPLLFQTCLRLRSLRRRRAGWRAWRSAEWQMEERRHRSRGASMAAAASGCPEQEAWAKGSPTVGAVPVVSRCDAAQHAAAALQLYIQNILQPAVECLHRLCLSGCVQICSF